MKEALKDSRATIERLITGVGTALDAAKSSIATILRLEMLGRRIEKIVDAISLIVVQTSMLAVSGSVEAARAGSSGRGFAVVSNDIRNLAREASTSTENIKDTVRAILDQVASLRRDIEQVTAALEAEMQNNRGISGTLHKMDGDVAALGSAGTAILQGTDAILAAAVQGATGARQIAAAAEEASAAAHQAAAASTEQARTAEDLAAAIEEIASLANEMLANNG
jgi:methyl-accepting chemotaxis protein